MLLEFLLSRRFGMFENSSKLSLESSSSFTCRAQKNVIKRYWNLVEWNYLRHHLGKFLFCWDSSQCTMRYSFSFNAFKNRIVNLCKSMLSSCHKCDQCSSKPTSEPNKNRRRNRPKTKRLLVLVQLDSLENLRNPTLRFSLTEILKILK